MAPDTRIDGPAIVEERESTTVVGPGATARVADDGSLIIEVNAMTLDPVTVGIAAGRLASILDEQQATLVRTAFSTIVRESEDLACGVFDRAGPDARPVAQRHARPHQRDGHRRPARRRGLPARVAATPATCC